MTRLCGLTNTSYRVDTPSGRFVLRLPSPDPGPFVDRAHEIAATRIAADLGVGAPLVHAEPDGVMVTRLDRRRAADERRGLCGHARCGPAPRSTIARLHGSADRFPGIFDPARIVDAYAVACRDRTGRLPWTARSRIATGWPWR